MPPETEPDKYVRLREDILEQWHRLPPADQAAVLVEQLRDLLASDEGEPVRRALESGRLELGADPRLKPFKVTSVSRADLEEHFSPEEIAQLDDSDMQRLANKLEDWYVNYSFWDDLQLATRSALESKGSDG